MSQYRLTNCQRLEICRHKSLNAILKNKDLVTWVRQQYGLTVSTVTVGNILKRKQELEEMTSSNINDKKPRVSRHPLLEEALVFWILQCQARNVAVTGNLIKIKARKFREQLEIGGTVEFSNGWSQKLKQRNRL
ncbi:CENP-B-like protein 2 [Golovinomyces cichoracearum]|uniref:CENP-B-like protein 2 n=1 Tax=Golovinomyces cichoracearum TaxID=62708 RepID=A0A420IVP4_9PEZI|nr:CENP-B-like protein 2 [Golovinomyces cichoracearum]